MATVISVIHTIIMTRPAHPNSLVSLHSRPQRHLGPVSPAGGTLGQAVLTCGTSALGLGPKRPLLILFWV